MAEWTIFIDLLGKYGVWAVLLIPIGIIVYLLRVILDEDRSAAWRARIYKAIYRIAGTSEAEKKYIENDIASRINLARRSMPFGTEYLPKGIRIKWFETGQGETADIDENEIVVRLSPAESQEKNIVLITSALVKRTSLAGIRHIVTEPLEISLDLNLIKNLLKEVGDRRVLDWFFRNEYQPATDKSDEVGKWNEKVVEIDERGLFTRMLLVELDNYAKQIIGKASSPKMFDELAGFIDFLFKIATKSVGQETPLDFISRNIKLGVILVGETSKILRDGIYPYLDAFTYTMKRQLTSIYVIVFDKELLGSVDPQSYQRFVKETEMLSKEIEKQFKIEKDFALNYTCTDLSGKKRKAKIYHYIPRYIPQ